MTKLLRVEPARCKGKFEEYMWDDPEWVAEQKLDGSRYQLYFDFDGSTSLYSRRDFPRIEKSANVPHIAQFIPGYEGCIFDGEIRNPKGVFLGDTTRLMLMLPDTAVAEQQKVGKLVFTVFDMPFYRGHDMRVVQYKDRRKIVENAVSLAANPFIQVVDRRLTNKREYYEHLIANGGEGIVLKHQQSAYGDHWVKKKKITDVSVFIIGYQQGRGKYSQTLGALRIGVLTDDNQLVEVGKASGMTDEQRDMFWNNQKSYMYRVIDVRTQEMTRHERLREPRFLRVRDDISAKQCTFDKLRSDLGHE